MIASTMVRASAKGLPLRPVGRGSMSAIIDHWASESTWNLDIWPVSQDGRYIFVRHALGALPRCTLQHDVLALAQTLAEARCRSGGCPRIDRAEPEVLGHCRHAGVMTRDRDRLPDQQGIELGEHRGVVARQRRPDAILTPIGHPPCSPSASSRSVLARGGRWTSTTSRTTATSTPKYWCTRMFRNPRIWGQEISGCASVISVGR